MKDLLTNIVDKMSTNQVEKSTSRSTISEEQKSNGSRSVSLAHITTKLNLKNLINFFIFQNKERLLLW